MSSNNVKKSPKKREFSLEEIATAIRCGNMINSIRNKYRDPLIIRNKNLLFKKLKLKINLNQKVEPENPFSPNKIIFHKFLKQKHKTENEGNKSIQTKNNTLDKILPLIPNKNEKPNNDSLLITSGMFKQKDYCKDPMQKVKLGNIVNLKSNGKKLTYEIYPKIENVKKINDKYNLQLDLNYLNNNKIKNFKTPKKMSKNSLKNYLFYKYSSSSPNGININGLNTTKNENKHKKRLKIDQKNEEVIKKNTLSDYGGEYENFDKKNNINEDSNTFITKVNINKEEKQDLENDIISIQENNLKERNSSLFKRNKKIINHDQKVSVDCLYSKAVSKIEHKKIIYKSIDKTTFELQKEPSYKRFKQFESIIDKVIKTKKQ